MTVIHQIKILDRKIMQNEAKYDLDRKAAKISALSSNTLDKYEYLTGEDLGLKPSTVDKTKFDYSPLSKIFNRGLDKDDQREGLFKRLENTEDTNLTQLQAIKDQGEKQLRELKNIDERKQLKVPEFKKIDRTLDKAKLVCTKTNGAKYDFTRFAPPLKFIEKIHNYEIILDEAIKDKGKLGKSIISLKDYRAKNQKNKREKRSFRICKKIV